MKNSTANIPPRKKVSNHISYPIFLLFYFQSRDNMKRSHNDDGPRNGGGSDGGRSSGGGNNGGGNKRFRHNDETLRLLIPSRVSNILSNPWRESGDRDKLCFCVCCLPNTAKLVLLFRSQHIYIFVLVLFLFAFQFSPTDKIETITRKIFEYQLTKWKILLNFQDRWRYHWKRWTAHQSAALSGTVFILNPIVPSR